MPAQAGIQDLFKLVVWRCEDGGNIWIPAFAGMTGMKIKELSDLWKNQQV